MEEKPRGSVTVDDFLIRLATTIVHNGVSLSSDETTPSVFGRYLYPLQSLQKFS
jgi:hypothetical protein